MRDAMTQTRRRGVPWPGPFSAFSVAHRACKVEFSRVSTSLKEKIAMKLLHSIAMIVVIVGAINWVSGNDLLGAAFGPGSTLARLVYVLVGVAGLTLACTEIARCGAERRGTCPTA
jgi:uncharacterized membrane protein YuzA (DUF378 family)